MNRPTRLYVPPAKSIGEPLPPKNADRVAMLARVLPLCYDRRATDRRVVGWGTTGGEPGVSLTLKTDDVGHRLCAFVSLAIRWREEDTLKTAIASLVLPAELTSRLRIADAEGQFMGVPYKHAARVDEAPVVECFKLAIYALDLAGAHEHLDPTASDARALEEALRAKWPRLPVGAPTVLKFERPVKRAGEAPPDRWPPLDPYYVERIDMRTNGEPPFTNPCGEIEIGREPPAKFRKFEIENRVEIQNSPRYIDSDTLTEADIGRRFHVSRRVGTGITIRPGVYLLVSFGVTSKGHKLARFVAGGVDGRFDLRRLCLTPVDGNTRLLDTRPPGNVNAIGVFVKGDGSRPHPILVDPSLIPSAEV